MGITTPLSQPILKVPIPVWGMPTMDMVNHHMGHVLDFGWWNFQARYELLVHRSLIGGWNKTNGLPLPQPYMQNIQSRPSCLPCYGLLQPRAIKRPILSDG